jgi:alpha-galactosidase
MALPLAFGIFIARASELRCCTHCNLFQTYIFTPHISSLHYLSWARERNVCEVKLQHGTLSLGSMRGVSGHVHNPFAGVLNLTSADNGSFHDHYFTAPYAHVLSLFDFLLRFLMHYLAVCNGPPSETSGDVYGFSFVYSGNFLIEAELTETGRLRFNMGINPMGLQWHLLPGI